MNLNTYLFKDLFKLQKLLLLEFINRIGRFQEAIYNKHLSAYLFKYKKPFYRIVEDGDKFVLDLRDLRSLLGDFTQLLQFLISLKEQYKYFEIWISDKTIESRFPGKEFSQEAIDIFSLISSSIQVEFVRKNSKETINHDWSYLSLTPDIIRNTEITTINCQKYFFEIFKLKSLPINYYYDIDYNAKPDLKSLKENLDSTFNIIISPTIDLMLKVERYDRRYGVISQETFLKLEDLYLELQSRIQKEGITDIRFIYLNKKMYNMKHFSNILDLRHFEDYGLNFGSIFYFIQSISSWTIGSEGSLQQYMLMSSEMKHALYVDNHYWNESHCKIGLSAPFFMSDISYLDYDDAPNSFIPNKTQVIDEIFNDYYEFKLTK